MATLVHFVDNGRTGCWSRVDLDSGESVCISTTAKGTLVKKSRLGLRGPTLYEAGGPETVAVADRLAPILACGKTPPALSSHALKVFTEVALASATAGELTDYLTGNKTIAEDVGTTGEARPPHADEPSPSPEPPAKQERVMFLRNKYLQRLGGGKLERMLLGVTARFELMFLSSHKDADLVKTIRQARGERTSMLCATEAMFVYTIARAQAKLEGSFAEVGVFQGVSAKLICQVKGDRPLHLFDTFAGLPESSSKDLGIHKKHQYACSLESVKQYLADYDNVHFHQGLFPDSTADVEEQKYSFVHFDVDLYESTLACLEYFYPRMVSGGVMLSHDYGLLAGVRSAFTEFFADKPEGVIEVPTTQCMVAKA